MKIVNILAMSIGGEKLTKVELAVVAKTVRKARKWVIRDMYIVHDFRQAEVIGKYQVYFSCKLACSLLVNSAG